MICKATEWQRKNLVRCGQDANSCKICCIFHVCKYNWKDRDVWKRCEFFNKGTCNYKP